MIVWDVPRSMAYPDGVRYRAWLSEAGVTLFGFDNHAPKGPHLHVRGTEVLYYFLGFDALWDDIRAMIREEGFVYEE
jgi:hypothetical protein